MICLTPYEKHHVGYKGVVGVDEILSACDLLLQRLSIQFRFMKPTQDNHSVCIVETETPFVATE